MKSNTLTISDLAVTVNRKAHLKNLYVRILTPDGEVTVSAPSRLSDAEIIGFVLRRYAEIVRIRTDLQNQERQTKREYISGETHYLWGEPCLLQVKHESKRSVLRHEPGYLIMTVPKGTDTAHRAKVLNNWYRQELMRLVDVRTEACERITGLKANEYKIKNMKTRWGTCNIEARRIWLNLHLVKKPIECLDYIIIHELTHLLERNHTPRFNALVEGFCPQWREAKRLLNTLPLDYMRPNQASKMAE